MAGAGRRKEDAVKYHLIKHLAQVVTYVILMCIAMQGTTAAIGAMVGVFLSEMTSAVMDYRREKKQLRAERAVDDRFEAKLAEFRSHLKADQP